MKFYRVTDIYGNKVVYEATDMRMVLNVHEQLKGTEPIKIKQVTG